jgi:serine/threonine protein kinase
VTEELVLKFLRDILLGLASLEQNGYIHSDLKPSNILVTLDGSTAHLCDFEHLQSIDANSTRKHFGTFHYNPPERLYHKILTSDSEEKEKFRSSSFDRMFPLNSSPALDMWSLGLTFIETLFNLHPFDDIEAKPERLFEYINTWSLRNWMKLKSFKASEHTIDLAEQMLKHQPSKRITIQHALNHPALKRFQTQ